MKNKKDHFDIIIVGGGASGLMAAIQASECHMDVLVLEHQKKAGVKILSTGNGRCNLTNSDMSPDRFRCDDPSFLFRHCRLFPRQIRSVFSKRSFICTAMRKMGTGTREAIRLL